MNTSRIAAFAAIIAACAFPADRAAANQQSSTLTAPVGWLTASPGLVRAGGYPTLNWEITYPVTVIDHVTIVPPATINPKGKLDYQVRVLGAGVTVSNTDGSNMSFVPTEAVFSVNGGSYSRIFYGTNHDVNPGRVVASGTVTKNQLLRFGGRYYYNKAWGPFYTSTSGTNNVRTLVNGDYPPTVYSLINAPTLEDFIKPYLDSTGRVSIGPMDVIVFMELTHTDAQSHDLGYDMQDMVLLVTFKPKK